MRIISHRANIDGPNIDSENTIKAIENAIALGFDVEIDVWFIDKEYHLGHDRPSRVVNLEFLQSHSEYLWCHAKNLDAIAQLLKDELHCFWHEQDKYTMTSKQIIWAYPKMPVNNMSVLVDKDLEEDLMNVNIYGICTDYPNRLVKKCSK